MFDEVLEDPEEEFVRDMEGWLRNKAFLLCGSRSHLRYEEAVQEGRIELWRTYRETGDSVKAMAHAKVRMKAVAYNVGVRMTGEEPRERFTAPQGHDSLDREVRSTQGHGAETSWTLGDLLEGPSHLEGVEIAYHRGEILKAFNALKPRQQYYVYARFWCGIDGIQGSRVEGVVQAKDQNPLMYKDYLWTGSKTAHGAKKILAEKLAHLYDLIRT